MAPPSMLDRTVPAKRLSVNAWLGSELNQLEWSSDFVEARTHDGRKVRLLNVIDEFTCECLAIRVARKLKAADVIDVLSDLFILRGIPAHVRSDNGPEFISKSVQKWVTAVGAKTAYITPGKPLASRSSLRAGSGRRCAIRTSWRARS